MKKEKVPTATSQVGEALRLMNEPLTAWDIVHLTGQSYNRVSAALHHMRLRKAAEPVQEGNQIFWIATPETDDRGFIVEERRPEDKPRRRRKPRAKIVQVADSEKLSDR